MLGAMRRLFGISHPRRMFMRQVPIVRARYDAAQTTSDNMRHWAAADALSANTANSPIVRKTLRIRSRYEVANNTYAQAMRGYGNSVMPLARNHAYVRSSGAKMPLNASASAIMFAMVLR